MRCIITGGTGHVGRFVVKQMMDAGEDIAVLVRDPRKFKSLGFEHPRLTAIVGDLSEIYSYQDALKTFRPDVLIHVAWSGITEQERNDPEEIPNNVIAGLNVLRAAKLAGCTRFVGIGSQAEYGHVSGKISEEIPCEPRSGYGVAKFALMQMSRKYCELSQISWAWVRIFSTYGPADDSRHLIPYLINCFSKGVVPKLTKCEQLWDYLHVEDAARAIVALALHSDTSGIFNLGSGTAVPLREVVEMIREAVNPNAQVEFGTREYADDQVMHLEADISKLEATIGRFEFTSLNEGIIRKICGGA